MELYIRSQNKEVIIKVTNVFMLKRLQVDGERESYIYSIMTRQDGIDINLGNFESIEKPKWLITDIWNMLENREDSQLTIGTYKIPKDKEYYYET